jgi:uncharacterized repeat protein (TIGR01451 family)
MKRKSFRGVEIEARRKDFTSMKTMNKRKGDFFMKKEKPEQENQKTGKEVTFMAVRQFFLLFLLLIVICSPAFAEIDEKPDLALRLSVEKQIIVQDEQGKAKTEWRAVKDTDPGDVLRYTIRYTNKGKAEAEKAVITDPIPENTLYIRDSAEGKNAEITFSLDGKTFRIPSELTYTVKLPDGIEEERVATPDMYSHVKWQLVNRVKPNETGTLSFKVKVQ